MTTRQIRGGALSAVGLVCALAVSASVVRAQSALPTGWASREIGSTGMDGSATVSSGTWTITGGGANIWGTSDEFRFAYHQITGDVDIRVRLASFQDLEQFSKAGVMIRETLNGNSRNAFMLLRADSALFLQSRLALTAVRERVDELMDDVLDVGDQLPHAARAEHPAHHPPVPGVLGWVGAVEGRPVAPAPLGQGARQCCRERRLATAPHRDVADDDHRYRHPVGAQNAEAEKHSARGNERAEHYSQRHERRRQQFQSRRVPGADEAGGE